MKMLLNTVLLLFAGLLQLSASLNSPKTSDFLAVNSFSNVIELKMPIPLVINTWKFTNATTKAWETVFTNNRSAIDSLVEGCSVCEREQCDGTVGYGGSPDENGETTLDAMLMDGETMNVGAVGALRRIKDAIAVARHVLDYTKHTLLVGDQATQFAVAMGFQEETLQTELSRGMWELWKRKHCQPNFWTNVLPDPRTSCGPYRPDTARRYETNEVETRNPVDEQNHDTIGMVVIDSQGKIAAGTSTNGARNKIPGRVGDSPIPGAGAYADGAVGAAAATGDGDVMMRFLPSFVAVEEMRRGASPAAAGAAALRRIADKQPDFVGGIVVVRADGTFGAACHGLAQFPFSVCNQELGETTVMSVTCPK